jgi:hypothetical protein
LRTHVFAGLVLLALTASTVHAAEPSDDSLIPESQAHFEAGLKAYRAGRYREALAEFKAGYALSPRPAFLLNFAQTYRKLGRFQEAIAQCRRFLAAVPEGKLALEARTLLEQLRREDLHGGSEPEMEVSPSPTPSPPAVAAAAPVAPEAAAPEPTLAPATAAPPPPTATLAAERAPTGHLQLVLALAPVAAIVMGAPQAALFSEGGGGIATVGLTVLPPLALQAAFVYAAVAARDGGTPGTELGVGGGPRLERPRGRARVVPWIDADLLYVRTGVLDRLGFTVGAGIDFSPGSGRRLWLGPTVRYLQVIDPAQAGFQSGDAKTLLLGISVAVAVGKRAGAT